MNGIPTFFCFVGLFSTEELEGKGALPVLCLGFRHRKPVKGWRWLQENAGWFR